jgi:hypothetical protein
MSNQNRAVLRINILEDNSQTYDVLLTDGVETDNRIEVNCESWKDAQALLEVLRRSLFAIDPAFENRY